jgi:Glycosyl transferase family 2
MDTRFSYIITIHNKGFLLDRVLESIERNASCGSTIIPVLDGCTDDSFKIASERACSSKFNYKLVEVSDVHEIKSINAGLAHAPDGFCIIMQDDVILNAYDLEEHILRLWDKYQLRLGYLTFRMGCDVKKSSPLERLKLFVRTFGKYYGPFISESNHKCVKGDHSNVIHSYLNYYEDIEVDAGIKSPICLTPAMRAAQPFLDENLAPYCYDDFDMSLTAKKHGLVNILMPFPVLSELEWGGTRMDKKFSKNALRIMTRNRQYLYKKHKLFFDSL